MYSSVLRFLPPLVTFSNSHQWYKVVHIEWNWPVLSSKIILLLVSHSIYCDILLLEGTELREDAMEDLEIIRVLSPFADTSNMLKISLVWFTRPKSEVFQISASYPNVYLLQISCYLFYSSVPNILGQNKSAARCQIIDYSTLGW